MGIGTVEPSVWGWFRSLHADVTHMLALMQPIVMATLPIQVSSADQNCLLFLFITAAHSAYQIRVCLDEIDDIHVPTFYPTLKSAFYPTFYSDFLFLE